jgi:N-methylhydantoinase A
MAEVVVPEAPGVLAAFGLLAAAIEHHHARTLQGLTGEIDLQVANRCLDELGAAGLARMRAEGAPIAEVRVVHSADMRYVGQAYELEVPIAAPLAPAGVEAAVSAFHAAHERVYGYARVQQPVEFVNFRAVHRYPLPRPVLRPPGRNARDLADARVGSRQAHFAPGGFVDAALYDRERLPRGAHVPGPAIVEQADTTTVIPPGHGARVDPSGNLRIRRQP